ncbi:hypothetical protein [Nonomuraea sp. NPDC049480]|uniref:hypothetical protein n=1 Tax=Nonomuraea sp. NPDC049480 TaxID=3364353 RepID=UPI0037A278A4
MSVVLLPNDVLRVPTVSILPDGTRVHGTRDIAPGAPEYDEWRPHAISEADEWRGDAEDAAIVERWRAAASA